MSKTKNKQHSEIDHFKAQIKKLKSENRKLKRKITEFKKWEHKYQDIILEEEEPAIIEKVDKCPSCRSGKLRFADLKFVKLFVCDSCDYREKA